MKISTVTTILAATVGTSVAFVPVHTPAASNVVLSAESSRKAFFTAAAAGAFGFAQVANAGTMDQEIVNDPTEVWETGTPNANAETARIGRYTNARTQMTSNFAPIKRLTLERKSPVTRLDLNAPDFSTYKKTYPGLYKTVPSKAVAAKAAAVEPIAAAAPAAAKEE